MIRPTTFVLALLSLLFALSALSTSADARGNRHRHVSVKNYWAALCASRGTGCKRGVAWRARVCNAHTWMTSQPRQCQLAACAYCRHANRRRELRLCNSKPIVKNCFRGHRPGRRPAKPSRPAPRPAAPRPGKGCAYRGRGGRIYVPALGFPTKSPWARRNDHIVWKPNGGPGIDRAGSGQTCVTVSPDVAGTHYLTAITAAPHVSEHNDMWLGMKGTKVTMYRPSRRSLYTLGDGKLAKAYHWHSKYKIADQIFSKDHDPHQFLTGALVPGRRYQVCIAGRSSRFRVYAVVLVACANIEQCSYFSPHIMNKMKNRSPSKCY